MPNLMMVVAYVFFLISLTLASLVVSSVFKMQIRYATCIQCEICLTNILEVITNLIIKKKLICINIDSIL